MSNWRELKYNNFEDTEDVVNYQTNPEMVENLGGTAILNSENDENENIDEAIYDVDYSLFKSDYKNSLKKINHTITTKKNIKKIKQNPKFDKPLNQEIPVFHKADIQGGNKQLKKVIVSRDRDLIVQGVDKFMLSKDNDVNSYKKIGYYQDKKLKELIVVVSNNSPIDFNLELFNPSMPLDYLHSTSANLNTRVTIGGGFTDISYTDILFNMLANPTMIVNARLVVDGGTDFNTQAQLSQPLFFKNKNIEAVEKVQPMQLQNAKDLMQTFGDIVCFDIMKKLNRPFIPDGMDVINYKVLAGATASFCFYYKQHSLKKFFFKEAKENKILI